jgi:hypothetical protein
MKNMWQKLIVMNTRPLILLLTLTGILLAVETNYIQHGWINNDSVLYFEAAQRAVAKDWQGMMQIFPWPFFSLFIAGLHQLTGFSIHLSAQILNTAFFGIATFSFLSLVRESGGNNPEIAAGAILLFSSSYIVGDILPMLIRDQGFWAFFLLSILFFVRYTIQQRWQDALWWQAAMMLALLFRVEAIVYLFSLPLLLLGLKGKPFKQRLIAFIQASSLTLIALVMLTVVLLTTHIGIEKLGRLKEVFSTDIYQQITQKLFERAEIMGSQVLGEYLDEFGLTGLLLTFMYVMLKKTVFSTGIITTALAALTLRKTSPILDKKALHVVVGVMTISLVIMFLIITKVFVLSSRYIIPLSFMLMLLAAFSLGQILSHLHQKTIAKSWKKILLILILGLMGLTTIKNILPKPAGYTYEQEAARWLRQENSRHEAVYFDSARLRYYAGEPYTGSLTPLAAWKNFEKAVSNGEINRYRFIALNLAQKHPEKSAYIQKNLSGYAEVARFSSDDKKKSIVIFKKAPSGE